MTAESILKNHYRWFCGYGTGKYISPVPRILSSPAFLATRTTKESAFISFLMTSIQSPCRFFSLLSF